MPKYNKLVRDKIPEIIAKSGKKYTTLKVTDSSVKTLLVDKLIEEAGEFMDAPSVEEMADIFEIIDEILSRYGYTFKEVMRYKRLKKEVRGGFEENIFLYEVKD